MNNSVIDFQSPRDVQHVITNRIPQQVPTRNVEENLNVTPLFFQYVCVQTLSGKIKDVLEDFSPAVNHLNISYLLTIVIYFDLKQVIKFII